MLPQKCELKWDMEASLNFRVKSFRHKRLFHTSVTKSFSSFCNWQAFPTIETRSLHLFCFGTKIVWSVGGALPSPLNTLRVNEGFIDDDSGKERYMKGSKVTETLAHTGHTRVDLYWPYQRRSIESFPLATSNFYDSLIDLPLWFLPALTMSKEKQ